MPRDQYGRRIRPRQANALERQRAALSPRRKKLLRIGAGLLALLAVGLAAAASQAK